MVNADTDDDFEIGQVIEAGGGHNSNVPPQYIYLNYGQKNKQEPPTTSYKDSRLEICATRLESPFTDRFQSNETLKINRFTNEKHTFLLRHSK